MRRQISEVRKATYYAGNVLIVIGMILFLSTFVTFVAHFTNTVNFANETKSCTARAFVGMILMMVGVFISNLGVRSMIQNALNESDIDLKQSSSVVVASQDKAVMIKCRECGKLNEEVSKFCQACGKAV